LDAATYEEVEHDPASLGQAALVVLLAAVATVVGTPAAHATLGIVSATVGTFVGWAVSAGFLWLVGVLWMRHTSDFQELLRTIGFATAPQLAMVVGVVGALSPVVSVIVAIWGIAAYVVAVRQALDVSTGRSVVICLLAFAAKVLVVFLMIALIGLLVGGAATAPH
jgi:hypothetical protein